MGEGGFLIVAIAAGSFPANSPSGRKKKRQEVGGEVGRGRGQRFNRAMRCRGNFISHQCAVHQPVLPMNSCPHATLQFEGLHSLK